VPSFQCGMHPRGGLPDADPDIAAIIGSASRRGAAVRRKARCSA
jgi:hypothetical protein